MKKQKIRSNIFVQFVTGSLSTEEMREIGKTLKDSGEYNSAMESAILNYRINAELAEEMLGIDTEINLISKKEVTRDRKTGSRYSNVADIQSSIIKNSIDMKEIFSKEDLKKVGSLVDLFNETQNPERNFEDNLVDFYLQQFPGTFPEDAREIVHGIKNGVVSFNTTLNEALRDNGVNYIEKLKELGEGKTNEEKYEIYINFLATLNVLETGNLNIENAEMNQTFEDIKDKIYTVKENVTDEDLDEVIKKVAEALDSTTFTLFSAEMLNQLLENLPEGESAISEIIRGSEEDVKIKMLTSLATYMAHQKGELESTRGTELSVEQITINVCTGIEETRIVEGVKKGVFTVDNAILLLKIIGGVALYVFLLLIFAHVASSIGALVGGLLIGLFGVSKFIAAVALIAAVACTLKIAIVAVRDYIPEIMKWVEDKFDLGVKAWREKAWPYIQEKANEFADWIKELINRGRVSDEEVITDTTENVPVQV